MRTIKGYKRPDGRFGIRNTVIVISLVQCANSTVQKIALQCDAPAITIDTGCGEYKDNAERTNLGLIRAGGHPNVYGVLLVTLGCQWISADYIRDEIIKFAPGKKVHHVCIQQIGGMKKAVDEGVRLVKEMQAEALAQPREDCPISGLVVSSYCGGSDWTSALAGNTTTGAAADLVVRAGGSNLACGVRGMPGAEDYVIGLAKDYDVGLQILEICEEYRHDVLNATGQSISEVNPTPGNIAGGITTLAEKAVSNMKLQGHETVQGVVQVGEYPPYPGNWFMDNRMGGNDIYAATALSMGGAHLDLFCTGLGTPLGHAVMPVIKITGNPETNRKYGAEMIDFSAGEVITGEKTIDQCAEELFDLILRVANGEPTKGELNQDYSYAIPPFGKF